MGIKIGNTDISKIKIGSTDITKVYLGSTQVRPSVPATAITLNKSSISMTTAGQTSQLTATLTPSGSTSTVSWSSSNTSIATVSSSGLVTCVTPGSCTITATTNNGLTATCGVTGPAWTPDASRTLLYLPLKSNVSDQSGNTGRTFTTSGLTYTTVGGVQSVNVGSSGGIYLKAPYPLKTTLTDPITVSIWVYTTISNSGTYRNILDLAATNGERQILDMVPNQSGYVRMGVYNDSNDSTAYIQGYISTNTWHNIVYTITSSASKIYIDGTLSQSGSGNPNGRPRGLRPYYHDKNQGILTTRDGGYSRGWNGNARELIMENVEWTAQEVADYYTTTKAQIGF